MINYFYIQEDLNPLFTNTHLIKDLSTYWFANDVLELWLLNQLNNFWAWGWNNAQLDSSNWADDIIANCQPSLGNNEETKNSFLYQRKKMTDSSFISQSQSRSLLLKQYNLHLKADDLLRSLLLIESDFETLVYGKEKAHPKIGALSTKRSRYIGVWKNGTLWQALITINSRKTYIGTYQTEDEAARAFDFYSILLHSLTAKTNFSYTKANIVGMIASFKHNGNNFYPRQLFSN